ncbi:hypothetical protein EON63_13180 [archaeon]|nr:MAG: hypothetical protein EON63_13180 [archaeon]
MSCTESLVSILNRQDFLGLAIMQEANQGGEYWRHFVWFDTFNPETEPLRLCAVGSWFMPNPPFKKLTRWSEGEILRVPGVKSRKCITNMVYRDNVYFWSLKPYYGDEGLEESCICCLS